MSGCLYIIPCSQTKAQELKHRNMPAKEAYRGQAFTLARRWCESTHSKWCILSGGYGFLWPDTMIEWYDEKMDRNPFHTRTAILLGWLLIVPIETILTLPFYGLFGVAERIKGTIVMSRIHWREYPWI